MGQRIIGLTGGIATGKSTVSHYLGNRYDLPVLDADIYARQAVEPDSAILAEIAQRYGSKILSQDGTLNRRQLGAIIFNDAGEKAWVERQIHPYVRRRFTKEMEQLATTETVVQVIPLLFEADLTEQVTEVWVVVCSEETQLARLMTRDLLSRDAAQARILNQWPLIKKVENADVVLNNDSTLLALSKQVDRALAN